MSYNSQNACIMGPLISTFPFWYSLFFVFLKKMLLGLESPNSFGKVFVAQAWGPEFDSQHAGKKLNLVVHEYNLGPGLCQAGGVCSLLASQPSLLGKFQAS